MSDPLNERLNQILPRLISDDFLSGSGIGNEIAFYLFDYPPEDELRVRDYLHTLLDHLPKQRHGLRVKHVNLFDLVLDYLKDRKLLMFNAQRDSLPALERLLAEAGPLVQVPGLDGPASNGVLSLQTMCEGVVSWQQLEELERAGARGLMVLAVERSLA